MRVAIGDGWSIELPGVWTADRRPAPSPGRRRRGSGDDPDPTWRAPGRTLRVHGLLWWCTDVAGVLADLDGMLPPDPAGKVAEGGRGGIGVRAAWFYRSADEPRLALHGYTFTDDAAVGTVLTDASGHDPAWLFAAWRSLSRPG